MALMPGSQALAQAPSGKPPKPPKPAAAAVSLDARPNPLVFGSLTTLSGKLTGQTKAGVVIRLEQDATLPYGDSYQPRPSRRPPAPAATTPSPPSR